VSWKQRVPISSRFQSTGRVLFGQLVAKTMAAWLVFIPEGVLGFEFDADSLRDLLSAKPFLGVGEEPQ
jgi:hypothetical protein